jgi:hypothetical protein
MGAYQPAIQLAAKVIGAVIFAKGAIDQHEDRRRAKNQAEDLAIEIASNRSQQEEFNAIAGLKYKPASAQSVTVGYQNYLNTIQKIAPYYVSRYGPRLRSDYVRLVDKREKQAAKDQPILDTIRKNLP